MQVPASPASLPAPARAPLVWEDGRRAVVVRAASRSPRSPRPHRSRYTGSGPCRGRAAPWRDGGALQRVLSAQPSTRHRIEWGRWTIELAAETALC